MAAAAFGAFLVGQALLRVAAASLAAFLLGQALLAFGLAPRAAQAQTEEKPLFELGVVVGPAYLPDYPAAAQNHIQPVTLPYFVLRGGVIRSDERGLLRGSLIKTDRFEQDVSLDGAPSRRFKKERCAHWHGRSRLDR